MSNLEILSPKQCIEALENISRGKSYCAGEAQALGSLVTRSLRSMSEAHILNHVWIDHTTYVQGAIMGDTKAEQPSLEQVHIVKKEGADKIKYSGREVVPGVFEPIKAVAFAEEFSRFAIFTQETEQLASGYLLPSGGRVQFGFKHVMGT